MIAAGIIPKVENGGARRLGAHTLLPPSKWPQRAVRDESLCAATFDSRDNPDGYNYLPGQEFTLIQLNRVGYRLQYLMAISLF